MYYHRLRYVPLKGSATLLSMKRHCTNWRHIKFLNLKRDLDAPYPDARGELFVLPSIYFELLR